MRLVPVVPNARFNQQRHVDFAAVLHNFDYFLLCGVEVFFGHFEDEFIVYLHDHFHV